LPHNVLDACDGSDHLGFTFFSSSLSRHSLVSLGCNFFCTAENLFHLIHVVVKDKPFRSDHWMPFNADEGL